MCDRFRSSPGGMLGRPSGGARSKSKDKVHFALTGPPKRPINKAPPKAKSAKKK